MKKISRNRNRRILRRIKDDDIFVNLRNAIQCAKRKNNYIKLKKLEIQLINLKYGNNPD